MEEIDLPHIGEKVKLHLVHKGKRTTVVIDALMYEYLVMSLGMHPDSSKARKTAENWLEERMKYFFRHKATTVARYLITAQISKPELEDQIQKQRIQTK